MKKVVILSLGTMLLVSSCGSYNSGATTGGFMGAQLGSILGSAIGGISGGPRGSDIGTIVGMAGGAIAGATIGHATDQANQKKYETYKNQRYGNEAAYDAQSVGDAGANQDSGFDPANGGDDVIDFGGDDATRNAEGKTPSASNGEMHIGVPSTPTMHIEGFADSKPALELRNVRFVDGNGDMTLHRGELAKIVMEVYNNTSDFIYGVQPIVVETTGNKHVAVSAPILVEKMAPGKGIRYTAMVKADNRIKEGTVKFVAYAKENAGQRTSAKKEISVETCK